MYQPPHFVEERTDVLHALIRAHPLGLLICNGENGPIANPVPFLLDPQAGERGVLKAHLARANAQWKSLEQAPQTPVLAVFRGPQAYVSPSWYATKAETGKVVPTWNYATVQVRGLVTVHHDPAWLRRLVGDLTEVHERSQSAAWAVSDAPGPFIAAQLRGIVGLEIAIGEISGKWKVSQNRPAADRSGVEEGLLHGSVEDQRAMAGLVRAYGLSEEG